MPDAIPLRDILTGILTRAKDAAKEALIPPCSVCGERKCPPFPCISCGEFSCPDHGFFCVSSMSSICVNCADGLEGNSPDYPWCELLTEKDIKSAFRQRSKDTHPDREGGDRHRFSEVQQAYREALRRAKKWKDS